MPYPVSARAYLHRAKQRLLENTNEAIFYAAFELRCCVESRQEEYADELEFLKTKIKPWNIGKTASTLERIFESKKIARVTMASILAPHRAFSLYYTPVPKKLYKSAEKLGDLLHRMKAFKADDDLFWSRTRDQIKNVYRDAWYSCQGKLLTPPLFDHPLKVEDSDIGLIELMAQAYKEKAEISMKIEYLERPPQEWICDLQ